MEVALAIMIHAVKNTYNLVKRLYRLPLSCIFVLVVFHGVARRNSFDARKSK